MRHVAFLRGINVTGNKIVKMDVLKAAFASMGFKNIQTILASGNVVFDAPGKVVHGKIEEKLQKTFGFTIPVLVRSMGDINKLLKANPFKGVSAQARRYVTFLAEKPKAKLALPCIVRSSATEVCWALDVGDKTVDLMAKLEKAFGKNITTRNWNTLEKITKAR